ncbi:hypothetical protein AgCh_031601 [Apium graveolens]
MKFYTSFAYVTCLNAVADMLVSSQFNYFQVSFTIAQDPTSFIKAVQHDHWVKAMNLEPEALEENQHEMLFIFPADQTVYMKFPQGYSGFGIRTVHGMRSVKSVSGSQMVCRLRKSLYGLKQAPRQWNKKLSTTLLNMGYSQFKSDYSLFSKAVSDTITLVLMSEAGFFVSEKKYVTDLLKDHGLSNVTHLKIPLDAHLKLSPTQGQFL